MSVKRLVNSRTWSDKWVETLSTVEKLLWLYLLTNDQTNMLGIYEITLSRMVFETGLTKPQVTGALKRFEQDKRAHYFFEEWIFMVNHFKNQAFTDSGDKKKNNMLKSAEALYYKLPKNVLEKLDSMGFDAFERLSMPLQRGPVLDVDKDIDVDSDIENTKSNWKTDFSIYLKECKAAYREFGQDTAYIETQSRLNPGVNVPLSIEKGYTNFWGTEAGWKFKKRAKTKVIDWKSTITTSITLPQNRVYLTKEEQAAR